MPSPARGKAPDHLRLPPQDVISEPKKRPRDPDCRVSGIALTLEDIALLAGGTGSIPDDTATRLQALDPLR